MSSKVKINGIFVYYMQHKGIHEPRKVDCLNCVRERHCFVLYVVLIKDAICDDFVVIRCEDSEET